MRSKLAIFSSLFAMSALIICSEQAISACRHGLTLCYELIIPSLFPFFIVSILLNKLGFPAWLGQALSPVAGKVFGVSGPGLSALIMGLCGGYPLGAAYIADMHKEGYISDNEAEKLLGFCNNSGPAFIIGAVGTGVFNSAKVGVFLYGIHIIAALICGLILGHSADVKSNNRQNFTSQPFSAAFTETVRQALISILNVCAFVIVFSVLTGIINANGGFHLIAGRISDWMGTELQWSNALLTGFFELGSGCGAMRGMALNPINLALAAFLIGWGGISVHYQTSALFVGTNIKSVLHLAGRLMNGTISAVLAYMLYFRV